MNCASSIYTYVINVLIQTFHFVNDFHNAKFSQKISFDILKAFPTCFLQNKKIPKETNNFQDQTKNEYNIYTKKKVKHPHVFLI